MTLPKLLVAAMSVAACGRTPPAELATLAVGVPFETSSLDPHAEDKLANMAVLTNVYEPLVGTTSEMALRPALAEAWENPDLLTWIFRLRPGVRFHGGRPLEAADVAYSFERLLGRPDLEMRSYLVEVASVEVLDPATVRVRTEGPTPLLLNRLRHVLIVPRGSTDDELRSRADGTGPYRLVDWKPGERVRLERYPDHWAAAGAIAAATFHLGLEPEAAIQGLLDGRFDLARADSRAAAARLEGDSRFEVVRRDNLFVKFLAFALDPAGAPFAPRPNPFLAPQVRRALHVGIDRHLLVRELPNFAVPAVEPVPRFVFGYDPGIVEPAHDVALARALLAEAGYPDGFDVELVTRRIMADGAELVAAQLLPLGIRVRVEALPDAQFFERVNARQAGFWLTRFGCVSGDGAQLLQLVIHSAVAGAPTGTSNYSGFEDPRLDAAIDALAGHEELPGRLVATQRILAEVMDRLLVVPLYNDQDLYAFDRRLAWQPRSDSYLQVSEMELR